MRVVGFDPGLRITGFGVIELNGSAYNVIQAGVIRVPASQEMAERLREIYSGVSQVLEEANPSEVAIEELYSNYKHPRTAILMGHARGMIFLAAAERGLPVRSYAAKKIKQTLTGNGSASKLQMQRAIQSQLCLGRMPEPPDVADALAVALCHLNHSRRPWKGAPG
jgi:crossover junction endodeoxyribonuclease RuvC